MMLKRRYSYCFLICHSFFVASQQKQTVERLLKKKDKKRGSAAKAAATGGKSRVARRHRPPGYRYFSNKDGVFISVQLGLPFPLPAQKIAQ